MIGAAAAHLANQATGGVLIALVVALVLFIVAGVMAILSQAWWAGLMAAGLCFVVVAFLVT